MNGVNFLQPIGRTFFNALAGLGRLTLFAGSGFINIVRPPYYPRLVLKQMIERCRAQGTLRATAPRDGYR